MRIPPLFSSMDEKWTVEELEEAFDGQLGAAVDEAAAQETEDYSAGTPDLLTPTPPASSVSMSTSTPAKSDNTPSGISCKCMHRGARLWVLNLWVGGVVSLNRLSR